MNSIFAVIVRGSKITKFKPLKRLIYCLAFPVVVFTFCSYKIDPPAKKDTVTSGFKVRTIVVDAGHGGKRGGASGAYSIEKNVTLAIAFKLQKAIEKEVQGVKVVMTRTNDEDILWQTRSDIANNNKGDLFISIHCNSLSDKVVYSHGKRVHVPDQSGRGVLELVYGYHRDKEEAAALRENLFEEKDSKGGSTASLDPIEMIQLNEFKKKYRKNSIRFATLVNEEFTETDGRPSDGVKEQGILVLCHSAMPAVLIETGFINNPRDEAYLNSQGGQDEIVATIIRAIKSYKSEIEH